mmetsp:Transcript_5524/g.6909  ORF Transcript_5524/g.6909 Transcript_5524/m.6909 type:complete len:155 (+) Transcript_5524:98-562(+)
MVPLQISLAQLLSLTALLHLMTLAGLLLKGNLSNSMTSRLLMVQCLSEEEGFVDVVGGVALDEAGAQHGMMASKNLLVAVEAGAGFQEDLEEEGFQEEEVTVSEVEVEGEDGFETFVLIMIANSNILQKYVTKLLKAQKFEICRVRLLLILKMK